MNIVITRGISGGAISAIPSKSDAHRAFIAAALSGGSVKVRLGTMTLSQDIAATLRCLRQLGCDIHDAGTGVWECAPAPCPEHPLLDCGESGSTLRFMLPVAAALGVDAEFKGGGRLPERPIADLVSLLEKHSIKFSAPKLPFAISGKLAGERFELPGNVSSQYITGMLLALFSSRKSGSIELTTKLESSRYVDMTVAMLRRFGARIDRTANGFEIGAERSTPPPRELAVEGDWSNAAAFLVSGALGGKVTVKNLAPDSLQPDRAVVDILRNFGAQVEVDGDAVSAAPGTPQCATVDVSESPDLLPVLAVLAARSPGQSRFVNAARLRLKESDRLSSTAQLLRAVGIAVEEKPDELDVYGGNALHGAAIDSCNDHRIVMAATAAATLGAVPLRINGAEAIDKSQPSFFSDYAELGGIIEQQTSL